MITMTMTMKKPERLAFGGAAGGLVQQNCYNNSPGEKVGANPGDAGHNPCVVPVNKERESSGCTASVSQLQQVVHPTRAPVARRQYPKDQNIFLSTIKKRPPSVPRTHEPISALKTKHVRDNTSATSAQPHIGTKKKRSLIFNSSEIDQHLSSVYERGSDRTWEAERTTLTGHRQCHRPKQRQRQ